MCFILCVFYGGFFLFIFLFFFQQPSFPEREGELQRFQGWNWGVREDQRRGIQHRGEGAVL
jgi:hypothetical protein